MGECRTALEIFSSELKILYILCIFKPMQSTIHVQLTFHLEHCEKYFIQKKRTSMEFQTMHELCLDNIKCVQCTRFRTSCAHLNGWIREGGSYPSPTQFETPFE